MPECDPRRGNPHPSTPPHPTQHPRARRDSALTRTGFRKEMAASRRNCRLYGHAELYTVGIIGPGISHLITSAPTRPGGRGYRSSLYGVRNCAMPNRGVQIRGRSSRNESPYRTDRKDSPSIYCNQERRRGASAVSNSSRPRVVDGPSDSIRRCAGNRGFPRTFGRDARSVIAYAKPKIIGISLSAAILPSRNGSGRYDSRGAPLVGLGFAGAPIVLPTPGYLGMVGPPA